jgi:hypothetical protein
MGVARGYAHHRKRPIPTRREVRMSLRKKQTMTEKKISANQRNGRGSHGPATPEGGERIRAALLRHGFHAEAEEVAMRALGEDPAPFQELLAGLRDTYNPTDAAQEGLATRLNNMVCEAQRSAAFGRNQTRKASCRHSTRQRPLFMRLSRRPEKKLVKKTRIYGIAMQGHPEGVNGIFRIEMAKKQSRSLKRCTRKYRGYRRRGQVPQKAISLK